MQPARKLLIGVGAGLVLAASGAGIAIATGEDDADEQATGPGASRARAAALQITGGGRANSVERDSENGATWEVEVTKRDGRTVDVRLDAAYRLVVTEDDNEAPDDKE
jgi:uncharacterized membrane protein YkoI